MEWCCELYNGWRIWQSFLRRTKLSREFFEMLPRSSGKHSEARKIYLNATCISRPAECQFQNVCIQFDQSLVKRLEMYKTFVDSFMRFAAMLSVKFLIWLESVMESSRGILRYCLSRFFSFFYFPLDT